MELFFKDMPDEQFPEEPGWQFRESQAAAIAAIRKATQYYIAVRAKAPAGMKTAETAPSFALGSRAIPHLMFAANRARSRWRAAQVFEVISADATYPAAREQNRYPPGCAFLKNAMPIMELTLTTQPSADGEASAPADEWPDPPVEADYIADDMKING